MGPNQTLDWFCVAEQVSTAQEMEKNRVIFLENESGDI